jgi:hypothetical protein
VYSLIGSVHRGIVYWPNCALHAERESLPERHAHLGEMLPVVSLEQDQTRQVCMSQPSIIVWPFNSVESLHVVSYEAFPVL